MGRRCLGGLWRTNIVRTQVELGPDLIGEPSAGPVRQGPAGPAGAAPVRVPVQPVAHARAETEAIF